MDITKEVEIDLRDISHSGKATNREMEFILITKTGLTWCFCDLLWKTLLKTISEDLIIIYEQHEK